MTASPSGSSAGLRSAALRKRPQRAMADLASSPKPKRLNPIRSLLGLYGDNGGNYYIIYIYIYVLGLCGNNGKENGLLDPKLPY